MAPDLILSLFLGGIHAGSLVFASFVSARTIQTLVHKKDMDTLRKFFPIWWPNGRDLMGPLNILAALAYLTVYLQRGGLENLGGIGAMVFTVLWTGIVMMEDIGKLRELKDKDLGGIAKSFCWKHHVRTLVALMSFAWICWKRSVTGE